MTLKSLIQRLLDSRTTPAEAGHASKPGSAVPVDYNPSASVDYGRYLEQVTVRLVKTIGGGGIKLLRNFFCKEVAYA